MLHPFSGRLSALVLLHSLAIVPILCVHLRRQSRPLPPIWAICIFSSLLPLLACSWMMFGELCAQASERIVQQKQFNHAILLQKASAFLWLISAFLLPLALSLKHIANKPRLFRLFYSVLPALFWPLPVLMLFKLSPELAQTAPNALLLCALFAPLLALHKRRLQRAVKALLSKTSPKQPLKPQIIALGLQSPQNPFENAGFSRQQPIRALTPNRAPANPGVLAARGINRRPPNRAPANLALIAPPLTTRELLQLHSQVTRCDRPQQQPDSTLECAMDFGLDAQNTRKPQL